MLTNVATGDGGYKQASLPFFVGLIIRTILSLLGVIFIILIILGGYNWMLSEGNEQKVEKAQNYIRRAIIGLIITLSAWAIWSFVLANFIMRS
jgi:TRAP-type C4-dicarboxylate transport system permease small subunit